LIDLHLHLIPAVDDGAASLEEAVELCRIAARDGCTALVATPHRRRDEWPDLPVAELERRLAEVARRADVAEAGPAGAPRLLLGGEVRVDSELLRGLDREDLGGAIPLAGSRYLLLELEPHGAGPDPVDLISRLVARGWRPIVAHPELTSSLVRDPACVERMASAGALFQVTAMSVTGDFGRPVRERAAALIESGLAQFVASDAHRPGWRPTGLGRARREIERRWGAERAAALTELHPAAVIADRPLPELAASA
jgi:protein-tyrosine phosphatase